MTVPGASAGHKYEQGVAGPGRRPVSGPARRAALSRAAAFWPMTALCQRQFRPSADLLPGARPPALP
jgi:hypothetical protein